MRKCLSLDARVTRPSSWYWLHLRHWGRRLWEGDPVCWEISRDPRKCGEVSWRALLIGEGWGWGSSGKNQLVMETDQSQLSSLYGRKTPRDYMTRKANSTSGRGLGQKPQVIFFFKQNEGEPTFGFFINYSLLDNKAQLCDILSAFWATVWKEWKLSFPCCVLGPQRLLRLYFSRICHYCYYLRDRPEYLTV